MADPTVNLQPLLADQFRSADAWMAGLQSADEWAADLVEPFDDVPDFSKAADPEVDVAAGLPADRAIVRPAGRRLFRDFRADPDALKHLSILPPPGPRLVLESSANLRSCKNVEQFTLFRCPKLYAFHHQWMADLLGNPPEREAADVG